MAMRDRARPWLVLGAAMLVAALRLVARARVPDDYDSIGFVRALGHFDMAALQPHFPGYPVYVALGRVAVACGLGPLTAATLVSALAGGVTAAAVWRLARVASASERGAWAALALYAAAWLPWQLGGAALSDATATALMAGAFAALTFDGARAAVAAGALMALALGTRASYWPLALSFAPVAARAPRRRAAIAGAAVGLAAWAVPFVVVVGLRPLWALGRTHLVGHFTVWGGSIATRSNVPLRLWTFARDLLYDGLFPHWLALVGAAIVVAVWARPSWSRDARRLGLVVALPYALWVLVGQNVIEQPRHLLPLVTLGCIALGAALARHRGAAAALALLALAPSLPLAWQRVHTPPAAAQAALWMAARYSAADRVAVFGGRSLRFFDELAPAVVTRPRTWLSEVDVELERLDRFPHHIFITSEVEVDATRAARVSDGPSFCRDARLDRAAPCLTLRTYRIGR